MDKLIRIIKLIYDKKDQMHNFSHTLRVKKKALEIAKGYKCDKNILVLGALLHGADRRKRKSILWKAGIKPKTVGKVLIAEEESQATAVPKTIGRQNTA